MVDRINRDRMPQQHVRHMEWVENDESPWGHWAPRTIAPDPASGNDTSDPDVAHERVRQRHQEQHERHVCPG